jgi:uncharacterized membrane protein YccC
VTFAAFAIGRWALGSATIAVFATFTSLALTGIADFGGSMRGRAAAITTSAMIGIGLAALGTWISWQGVWAGCGVMFVVVAAIALAGLLGGYAAAGSNALILFYVVAAGSAAPRRVIPDRIAGVALGGGLALVAALVLWPEPAHPQTLPHLGAALSDLAARLRRVAGKMSEPAGGASAGTAGIRARVDALVDRPAAPTASQRAALYLMNDIERLEGLISRLEQTPPSAGPDLATIDRSAADLSGCAALLSGVDSVVAADAAEPAQLDGQAPAPFSLPARLAGVVGAAGSHARAALGRAPDGPIVDAFTARRSGGGWADLVHGARRFHANLTLRSVHARDALRLGAGLALASAAVDAFGLQHGFWVAFATLTVVKSNLRATGRSVGEAIAGTIIGLLIAAAVIGGLEPAVGWYIVLLPVTVAAAIYANVAISFLAGQAGFTLVIVVLFNLLGPAGWRVGVVRVVDVLAGALAGLLIGALAWPRGASATIGKAAADLFESAADYLAATVHAIAGHPLRERPGLTRRQLAADAAVRAESTFAQYLGEHPPHEAASRWAGQLAAGNRLWYAADLIAARASGGSVPTAETIGAADHLARRYHALAASLRRRRSPPEPTPDAAHTAAASHDLRDWLDDLAAAAPSAGIGRDEQATISDCRYRTGFPDAP